MFDVEINLLTENGFTRDKIGNKIPTYSKDELLARELPITRNEYYTAGQNNIELARAIIVHPFEYDGQKLIEIDNTTYSVTRTYKRNNEEIELYLTQRVGR
ncbi:phage head closure protein [Enterococcus cecorum]|uniref:phage head closure protein n=1 Tax=Enterococcus cecorum TaxID=44008 RepID=UPI00148D0E8A|nr:phage head closure protein [Enterococcus cecorum]